MEKIRGCDWDFTKLIRDFEDMCAVNRSFDDYHEKISQDDYCGMNHAELLIAFFSAGFNRGMKWAIDKYGVKIAEEGADNE